ncbi:MAG: histidinol dehydrogenase, partial [Ginsengibacter sp.]
IGNYSSESAGDYATGTNHTLPTSGFAKTHSGVSLDSFVKKITFQEVTEKGILQIGKTVQTLAEAEGLQGHASAITTRLKYLNK